MPQILFTLGKGGVGKSTVAALTALFLAGQKRNTLLVSLDPAHNLSDVFDQDFSASEKAVNPYLRVIEIDQEAEIRTYLKRSEQALSGAYNYLSTFSLEQNFSVMRHTPGVEEYALLHAFERIIKERKKYDFLIFDMPPTALTLKFFALPQLSLVWLEKLREIRQKILEKEKIIHTLKLLDGDLERDRVLQNLNGQIKRWQMLKALFEDPAQILPVLIENTDKLSQNESRLIEQKLQTMHIASLAKVLNKSAQQNPENYVLIIPHGLNELGTAKLQQYLPQINFKIFYTRLCK